MPCQHVSLCCWQVCHHSKCINQEYIITQPPTWLPNGDKIGISGVSDCHSSEIFCFHCSNTIHDISQLSVLSAFCICLIPIISVEVLISSIACHLSILSELSSLYSIMLELTSVKTFYNCPIPNPIMSKNDALFGIQRMCLGVILWFPGIFGKCLFAFIHTKQGHLLTPLVVLCILLLCVKCRRNQEHHSRPLCSQSQEHYDDQHTR